MTTGERADRRRAQMVWAVAVIVMVVLALAASSADVRVWTTPPSTTDDTPSAGATGGGELEAAEPEPDPSVRSLPSWAGFVLDVVAVALLIGLVLAIVLAALQVRPWVPEERVRRRWWTARAMPAPLPEVADAGLTVDVEAAHAALARGRPRNAIVACWLQLEQDAAAVGLPRLESETSSEYVQRVVAASSVDPGPIAELATLYREARFSEHEVTSGHRERAIRALHGVVDALAAVEVRS